MVYIIKEMLISENDFTDNNYERLKKALSYIENSFIDSDGSSYLTVDFLIKINNKTTGPDNITLRKINVKPYGFDKIHMEKDLEDKLYHTID